MHFNPNLKVIDIPGKGDGVITTVGLKSNIPIYQFSGDLFSRETISHEYSLHIQIGLNKFMGPSGGIDDYINHSCNPNCALHIVGGRAILYTIMPIAAGTEITYDYSVTSDDSKDDFNMKCNCKEHNCRKFISGFKYLDDDTKKRYQDLNIVPKYILK